MADRELRDENTAPDPNDNPNQLEDLVRVDGPSKLSHEDTVPETQREIDNAEDGAFREGRDIDSGKTARELHDERQEASEEAKDEENN